MTQYSYSYNKDTKELTIWEDSRTLATVSDVEEQGIEEMFLTVVQEVKGIDF